MPRVGLLVFSETRAREDVYRLRKPIQDRETKRFISELSDEIEFAIPSCGEIRGKRDIRLAAREMEQAGVSSVILLVPIFVSPAMVAHASRLLGKPVAVVGNSSEDTFSQLTLIVGGAAVDQIGSVCRRIPGDVSDPVVKSELLCFVRAAETIRELRGSTFGCIGGRSLGISTGTADPAQWERVFGVDTEHIDQLEVVLRAQQIEPDRVKLFFDWVHRNYGAVNYKERRLDSDRLEKQIRSYLAVLSIIEQFELDFVGIKCQPELSNGYALQCLAVQMLNDPYDAEGPKDPIVCSCEADHDGALTMQILKLISRGQPTALLDIFHVDDKKLIAGNCGAMASYFAALSDDPKVNLCEVHLQPHGFGEAGGAATQFVCAPDEFTFARLYRKAGAYEMAVFKGQAVKEPREALKKYSWYRPTAFVEIDIDSKAFQREYGSNHVHCTRGDYTAELAEFCELLNIPCRRY
jgi:L-fucose isomerase